MRQHPLLAPVLISIAILAAGCAPIHVGSHVDPAATWASYHTFAWGPADNLPIGDPRLDNNRFFHDYMQGAVERHLREHGLVLADDPATADVQVHYHATVAEHVDVASANQTSAGGYAEPRVFTYEESTIVLDIVDARSERLVWRGWAEAGLRPVIDDQERMKQQVEQSVIQMLERLPI